MSLSRDFVEFVECLSQSGVDYLLVGGHALAFHGLPRFTKDIDFWIRPSEDNARRLLGALERFGFGGLDLAIEDFTTLGKVVQLGVAPNRIDIVNSIDGVDFATAWQRRLESEYAGVPLLVIHRRDLIANKRASGRPQDLLDVQRLESIEDGPPDGR